MTANDFFEKIDTWKIEHPKKRYSILSQFDEFIDFDFNEYLLGLYPFSTIKPLCYYNREAITQTLLLFNENPKLTFQSIVEFSEEISTAIFSATRENENWKREERSSFDKTTDIIAFDTAWHPEYIKYAEHIFTHLAKVPAKIIGTKKKKKYADDKIKIFEAFVQEGMTALTGSVDLTIRNAISHGGAIYTSTAIIYKDINEKKELTPFRFMQHLDNLVDNCHSLIISILLFISEHQKTFKSDFKKLPIAIKHLVLDGLLSNENFKLNWMVEQLVLDGHKQLNIYFSSKIRFRDWHNIHCYISCWCSINLNILYDRYAFYIDCGQEISASLILDGKRFQKIIKDNEAFASLSQVTLTDMLWYDGSRLRRRYHLIKWVVKLKLWEYIENARKKIEKKYGTTDWSQWYEVKRIKNNSSTKLARVDVGIVIKNYNEFDNTKLEQLLTHVVSKIKRKRFSRRSHVLGKGPWRRVKPSYIFIDVFTENKRLRVYDGAEWGQFVLCAVEYRKYPNKHKPLAVKTPDLKFGNFLVGFNKKLSPLLQLSAFENSNVKGLSIFDLIRTDLSGLPGKCDFLPDIILKDGTIGKHRKKQLKVREFFAFPTLEMIFKEGGLVDLTFLTEKFPSIIKIEKILRLLYNVLPIDDKNNGSKLSDFEKTNYCMEGINMINPRNWIKTDVNPAVKFESEEKGLVLTIYDVKLKDFK